MGQLFSDGKTKFPVCVLEDNAGKYHVALLGDSTIDNIVWVDNNFEYSISSLLRKNLPGQKITNLAADGFRTDDMLTGCYPYISYEARSNTIDKFPQKNQFFPLLELQKLKDLTHVVLSIGGNDIRVILGNMGQLEKAKATFEKNYKKILEEIAAVNKNIIIMLQYRPSLQDDQFYHVYQAMGMIPGEGTQVQKLNKLMEEMYPFVLQTAREMNLAVLDLPRTFDINDRSLYVSQIEPSVKGGQVISNLISYAIKNHDFMVSKFYYCKKNEYTTEINKQNTKWKIE